MIYLNSLDDPRVPTRITATIGNYDGVHLGHRSIIRRMVSVSHELNTPSVLITFNPHPATVVCPELDLKLICTREQKLEAIRELGVDYILDIPFTIHFARITADRFIEKILVDRLHVMALVVGDNFRFGSAKEGSLALLRERAQLDSFSVEFVPTVSLDDIPISSTLIRELVLTGEVEKAGRMLGRPYSLTGTVIPGKGRGSRMGIRTINMKPRRNLIPSRGVYVSEVCMTGEPWQASVTNIGTRPTFDESRLLLETHLLDANIDLYGTSVTVRFLKYLREERRFDFPDSLVEQIRTDIQQARDFFARIK